MINKNYYCVGSKLDANVYRKGMLRRLQHPHAYKKKFMGPD